MSAAVPAPPRTLPALHQVQPPWFDRVLVAFRAPSIVSSDDWLTKSRLLHLSFIHFISNNAPFLTGQLHRELAPPHWGRAQLKEPGTRNPLFCVGQIDDWSPAPSEVESGDVATWPMHRLDVEVAEDEKVAVGSDPTLIKVKISWCRNAARPATTPWVIVCLRLHAAAGSDVAVLDLVRQWVRFFKLEFPEASEPPLGHEQTRFPPRLDIGSDTQVGVAAASGELPAPTVPTSPAGWLPYSFRRELVPLYTTTQENRERVRTSNFRLLRFRYEAHSISQVIANCCTALRHAELQGHLAAAKSGSDNSAVKAIMGNISGPSDGLCVSVSLPLLSQLLNRNNKNSSTSGAGVVGPVNLHFCCSITAGHPLQATESALKKAVDATIERLGDTKEEQAVEFKRFCEWESQRRDRLPGYFLPRGDAEVDLFEVFVSPVLFDSNKDSTGDGDEGEYSKLDFFRSEHTPPHVLHCPPYAVPHRILLCNAPSKALVAMASPSNADGHCQQPITLSSVLDEIDVIVPIDASLVPKLLSAHGFRGRLVGEALPVAERR